MSTRLRTARAAVVAVALLAVASCTGDESEDAAPVDTSVPPLPFASAPSEATAEAISGSSALEAALLMIPAAAEVITFTDLSAVERRLGFEGLTSGGLPSDRLAFWEAARADGALYAGQRLYDRSSELSIDYGWTAEDVDWEVDFSARRTGCVEAMICDRSSGYIVALRRDLDWQQVLRSLQDNGFEPSDDGIVWHAPDDGEPFGDVIPIADFHAIASGNPVGVKDIAAVIEGAPSASDDVGELAAGLDPVESAFVVRSGCVSLDEALGPDANEDDVTAYFKKNDPTGLAEPDGYALGVHDAEHATVVLRLADGSSDDSEAAQRTAVLSGWPGLQLGRPFSEVAAATVQVDGAVERIDLDVRDRPALRAMAFTDDAPWVLCPTPRPS